MSTPALLIAYDPDLKKFLVRRIPMDGFPEALANVLEAFLKTPEQVLNPEPFLPARFQKYDLKPWIFNSMQDPEFEDLTEIAEYLYRFSNQENQWYLWVDQVGWIPLSFRHRQHPFPEDKEAVK